MNQTKPVTAARGAHEPGHQGVGVPIPAVCKVRDEPGIHCASCACKIVSLSQPPESLGGASRVGLGGVEISFCPNLVTINR